MPARLLKLSASPASRPPLIAIVAPARVALPTSLTVNAGSSGAAAPPCVKVAFVPAPPRIGTYGATCTFVTTVSHQALRPLGIVTPVLVTYSFEIQKPSWLAGSATALE